MLEEARASLPELPAARMARYEAELGLDSEHAKRFAGDPALSGYFEAVLEPAGADPQAGPDGIEPRVVGNWVSGDLIATLRAADKADEDFGDPTVPPPPWRSWRPRRCEDDLPRQRPQGPRILVDEGGDPVAIVEREGLAQIGGRRR